MADELVKMQDQFSGLDMGALIGGPLKAACDAQIMMAKATSDFIQHVGMPDMIVAQAKKFEGVKESPANSNNVIFNTHYYGHEVEGAAYPWCCAFVWDVFRMCGASKLFYDGQKTALCAAVESWGKNKQLTISNKSKGKKGDLVIFDFTHSRRACHIGIIIKNNNDGTYTTIEGNTGTGNNSNGGMVMKRTRSISLIRCIIRPKYDT